VPDGEDFDGVVEVMEANAVVAHTEAQFGRLHILEAFYVAFAVGHIADDGVE
jgi:hypothetical protein